MISIREIQFLLFLLLHKVFSEEPEPIFRAEGGVIEMGYCFGVDYIVVYRSALEGDVLLGNSSADSTPSTPPTDLQDRVRITNNLHLLGLQISHLKRSDSGIYRRECWQNKTLVTQHRQQLSVCSEEVEAGEITVREDAGVELLCNSSYLGVEGTFIRWYHEVLPSYKTTLLLDSKVSLDPVAEELRGVVEVRDNGASLYIPSKPLQNSQHFYCLVMKDANCLSFQSIYQPETTDVWDIFASQGDRVTLNCPSNHKHQRWETPLGTINATTKLLTSTDGSTKTDQLYILRDDESKNYSLVVPVFSDSYSGEYLCLAPFPVIQYFLILCSKLETRKKTADESGNVELKCEVTQDESHSVQWYRQRTPGENSLIQDSKDKSIAVPEDLRGRVTLSEDGSTLSLSDVTLKDTGMYWCVVLAGPEFLEDDAEYSDNDEDENTEDDEYDDVEDWHETYRCISKQETVLTLANSRNVATDPVSNTTPDPPAASNVATYALGAGLAGLLLAAVIAAVIAIKKRAKTSQKQRGAACGSGPNKSKDIEMKADPGCTERLNPSDEYDA